jgi:hypothetical protein
MADGTLVATAAEPAPELIPSLLAASDVLGTGWFAAIAAKAGPGKTVAVVGDGAVGLLGILAAKELVDVAVGVAGAKFTSITTPITTCGDAASSRRSIGSGSSSGNRRGNSRRSESQHEHHKLNPDPRGCHRCRAFGADLYRHPIHPSER